MRVTLTLVAVAAICGAAWYSRVTQSRIETALAAAAAFENHRAAAMRAAFDMRSGQHAYVAAAQNEAFWFDKVSTSIGVLRDALRSLQSATVSGEARAAVTEAAAALDEVEQTDRRIRGYVSSGQKLLASDIIFSDGLDLVSRVLQALDRAAIAAAIETGATRAQLLRSQIIAAGGAAAVAIVVILLLLPMRSRTPEEITIRQDPPVVRPTLDLDIRPPVGRAQARPAPVPAATPPPQVVSLGELANVCTDLARLSDSATLPAILARAAAALDASGIVLWVADEDRRELTPIAAHGYAPSMLARLPSLPTDAENVTAAAYRTGLLQTLAGRDQAMGAVAAPLVAPSGCLGVVSAEMRKGGEKEPARLAAVSIVAAQLATIVGPPAAQSSHVRRAT